MILRRIARPMLATVFVYSGVDALRHPQPRAEMAQGLVDTTVAVLPDEVTSSVPTDPVTLVRINGAVQVGGGILLATGKFPRVASAALAGSLIPTTVAGHAFWEETDPATKKLQRTQFMKNVSLLGGLLIAAADTEGKPSLAWRGRKKADALVAALPIGAKAGATAWDTFREHAQESASALGEKSGEAAHVVGEFSTETADKIRDRAPELAEAARERSAEVAERVRDRAPELAEAARERSTEFAELIGERSTELAELARQRSAELAELVSERAPELAESAREFAATATDKAEAVADDGRRRWRKARS